MPDPDERARKDELVEPLFAGLRGADAGRALEPGAAEEAEDLHPPDPWTHTARPRLAPQVDPDAEIRTAPLFVKALMLVIVLTTIAALFYFVFGP